MRFLIVLTTLAISLSALFSHSQGLQLDPLVRANPVSAKIKRGQNFHTRPFAKIPDENKSSARIICIVSRPGSPDLFVCTLSNIYRVKPDGTVKRFLNVASAIKAKGRTLSTKNRAHGGVRSIAFHPNFESNRLMYVSAMESRPRNKKNFKYISDVKDPIEADSVLLEFKYDPKKQIAIPSSYRNVFRVGMPVFDHPIKQIAFFGDELYIAHGDGSVQNAVTGGGQNDDALGKILRILPMKKGKKPYSIPSNNPFRKKRNMRDEVYALGFRNPHTICFSNSGTLYVADAGRANVEEVNLVQKGFNYGWSKREGTFVHLSGQLLTGVGKLPKDDAKNGFEYPAAQYGHEGKVGAGFIGQAIAGGCPIENGSKMDGLYLYADFPLSGKLYYSTVEGLKKARTRGRPNQLTQAKTLQAGLLYDHDNKERTSPRKYKTLGDVVRSEKKFRKAFRVDIRFGRGPNGELYWSSKTSGRVYLFTSSLPPVKKDS